MFSGAVGSRYLLSKSVQELKVSWRKTVVCRFGHQSNHGQSEFADIQRLFRGQRLHDRPLVWDHNGCALILERKQCLANGRPADLESFPKICLEKPIAWVESPIEDRFSNSSDDLKWRLSGL